MIREIVMDQFFLSRKCEKATREDLDVGQDLIDTLKYWHPRRHVVGLPANAIGVAKRIIVQINRKGEITLMYNPEIISHSSSTFVSREGCICIPGERELKRYTSVKVSYYDERFKRKSKVFKNEEAAVFQHEMDHLEGKLV